MKDISVYCLKYADSVLLEGLIFDGGNKEKNIPITFAFYLIKACGRNILIDCGCNTMPGFDMKKYYSPAFVLRQIGLLTDEITDVIITHSHHDHIEAIKYFKNAVIHISKAEYEIGKHYITEDVKVNVFENDYAINPQIKIIEWGGHSEGSAIVELKTGDNIHIFAGDECYTNANIERKICTGTFTDREKAENFVRKYSNKKYRVHTCHDLSLKTERII